MILILLQPACNNHPDSPLDPLDSDGKSPSMNSKFRPSIFQPELRRKLHLVPIVLAPDKPSAVTPAQHRRTFPSHPDVVVGRCAGLRDGVEEKVGGIGEGDGDGDGERGV